jgi:hypothetical protein
MLQQDQNSAASSLEQTFRSASRKLYPRLVLFEALTGFTTEAQPPQKSFDPTRAARREFLRSFAYLCDSEKGGATVTGAALQNINQQMILWLAANEGIRPKTRSYAEDIMQRLRKVDPQNAESMGDEVFDAAVQFCTPRLKYYQRELRSYAIKCRMQLRNRTQDETGESRHPFVM